MKYCKECKFAKRDWSHAIISLGLGNDQWRFAKCLHIKSAAKEDRVDFLLAENMSNSPRSYMYCSTMRGMDHLCGKNAKFFDTRSPLK